MSAEKKTKKPKSSELAVSKGSICIFYGGIIKACSVKIGCSESSTPNDTYDLMKQFYGKYVTCKYVQVENHKDVLVRFKKALDEHPNDSDIYNITTNNIIKILKNVSGCDTAKSLHEKQEKTSKKGTPKKAKSSRKTSEKVEVEKKVSSEEENVDDEEEEEEEEEEEKPKKAPVKKLSKAKAVKNKD
jgi:hypothetical protein